MQSRFKLVEAEPEPVPKTSEPSQQEEPEEGFRRGNQTQRRPNQQGGKGRRQPTQNQSGRGGPRRRNPPISETDKTYYLYMIFQAIEFLFSPDHLCRDTHLRSMMDIQGYVPIPFVLNYSFISCYAVPYQDIIHKLSENSGTESTEVDLNNELIRRKDWNKWLPAHPQQLYSANRQPHHPHQSHPRHHGQRTGGGGGGAPSAQEYFQMTSPGPGHFPPQQPHHHPEGVPPMGWPMMMMPYPQPSYPQPSYPPQTPYPHSQASFPPSMMVPMGVPLLPVNVNPNMMSGAAYQDGFPPLSAPSSQPSAPQHHSEPTPELDGGF